MAELRVAELSDPRLQPHTEHWVRYGPKDKGGKVKKISSIALARHLADGWEEVADRTGAPLPHVPGLPDVLTPPPDAEGDTKADEGKPAGDDKPATKAATASKKAGGNS